MTATTSTTDTGPQRPAGIDGSALPGPYGVGSYAAKLRSHLQQRPRVQLFGELWNLRVSRAKVYFELRDVHGLAVLDVARRIRRARPRRRPAA
jgi:exodeoxyribonuclease VII large subunit